MPLAYAVRDDAIPGNPLPALAADSPHSEACGSIEDEMVARVSHADPSYRDDNAKVCYYLEEAARGASYAASIKPYQRGKNGRDAWLSLSRQHAGKDKWDLEIKRNDEFLHNRQWKGQSNFPLSSFISQHRNAYISMEQCAEHAEFQLPNGQTRVKYLLDAILCNDAPLQAAMDMVRNDDVPGGKMRDFESAASCLLPHDPAPKQKGAVGTKRDHGLVSEAKLEVSSSTSGKPPSIGKTGVEFRCCKKDEFRKLSKEQREELIEHRKSNNQPKKKRVNFNSSDPRKSISELVAKEIEAQKKAEKVKENDEQQLEKYIMSIVSKASSSAPATSSSGGVTSSTTASSQASPSGSSSALKSILKRAK